MRMDRREVELVRRQERVEGRWSKTGSNGSWAWCTDVAVYGLQKAAGGRYVRPGADHREGGMCQGVCPWRLAARTAVAV